MNCKRQNVEAHSNDDEVMHFKIQLNSIFKCNIRRFRKCRFVSLLEEKSKKNDDVVMLCDQLALIT